MAGLNKITLIGNLGRDPEVRYTPDGLAVTNFSMAVTEKYKGEERTMWFRISAFGRLGEIAGEYLSKGKQVYVDGRLQPPSEWTDRDGKTRFSLEVIASNLVLLGSKGESYDTSGVSSSSGSYDTPKTSSAQTPKVSDGPGGSGAGPSATGPGEDDIPF
jgi:single-strand DNA-binding protein